MGIYKSRILGLRAKLKSEALDTILVSSPENRRYLSGFTAIDPQPTESSGFLLITQDQALFATDFRYKIQAEKELPQLEVFIYEKGLVESLETIVKRLDVQRVGFESTHLTYALFEKSREVFAESQLPIELVPTQGIVEDMRIIKDPHEVHAIEMSLELTERVFEEIIPTIKPGMTEKQLSLQIEYLIKTRGAEDVAFPPIVASGPNSSMPHATPTDREIQAYEPIIIDMGAKFEGYCSDMTRTIFVGEPEEKIKEIYRIVRKAQLHAIQNIRAGMKTKMADALARDIITQEGYGDYFGHSLGHGVGLATHEAPRINKSSETTLKENMVVTIEPGIYLPEIGGVRLENMVLIKKDGATVLNKNEHFYDF